MITREPKQFSHVSAMGTGPSVALTAHFQVTKPDGKTVTEIRPLSDVRGAIVWPEADRPGYFLFMGQEPYLNVHGVKPLILLVEGEAHMEPELFRHAVDAAIKVRAPVIYAKQPTKKRGIGGSYHSLWSYLQRTGIRTQIQPAPASDDERYGMVLVRDRIKQEGIEFPKFSREILMGQLRGMTTETDRSALYAFHALRYLLAGFEKHTAPAVETLSAFTTGQVVEQPSPRGWT